MKRLIQTKSSRAWQSDMPSMSRLMKDGSTAGSGSRCGADETTHKDERLVG
jgi:hypothetical protein